MNRPTTRPHAKKKKRGTKARVTAAGFRKPIPDVPLGTSVNSLGIVKAASEEARMETCPDCGYSGGRHARVCSHQPR